MEGAAGGAALKFLESAAPHLLGVQRTHMRLCD